jgi:hypothetical protein
MLRKVIRTTNDSEFILKAYLASDRDLYGALDKFEGWANVMLWDERREVLTLFADGEPFHIYRQAGATMLVQEVGQTIGLVVSGLGHPYEYAKVDADCVIQLDFGKYPTDFDAAFEEGRAGARKKEAKFHTYTGPVGGGYVNYSGYTNYSGYDTKGVGGYNANFRTIQAPAGCGGKGPIYQVQTGLDRLLEQERKDISQEDSQTSKARIRSLSVDAEAGAADAEGFRDEDYEQQRRRWSLQIAFEKYQGSGGGSDWNEFVSLQEKRERRTAA